jgi:hypothetical protein
VIIFWWLVFGTQQNSKPLGLFILGARLLWNGCFGSIPTKMVGLFILTLISLNSSWPLNTEETNKALGLVRFFRNGGLEQFLAVLIHKFV